MRSAKKFIAILAFLVLVLSFVGCGNKPTIADNTEHFDAITKTLALAKSYEGKDFLNDGIGMATVDAYTDGDTTRFKLASGNVIISRYYGVDTPESTSSIEKWGKAASKFTKDALSGATEIVLEATADKAQHDSYGTRYLTYVWYRTDANSAFKLLNLELVENGYSYNKGIATDAYPYNSYFAEAEQFARSIKLRLFSDLDDPMYSTEIVEMDLKAFKSNPELYYSADTQVGAKVKLYATLTGVTLGSTVSYTATQIDKETGETYTIDIYAGYEGKPATKMQIGHYYKIVGTVGVYGGRYQISDISYDPIFQSGSSATKITQYDYYLTFDSSLAYKSQLEETLYSDATIVSATKNGDELVIVATAQQREEDGVKEKVVTFTITVKNAGSADVANYAAGKKIATAGYQFTENSHEITVYKLSDVKLK